MSTNNNMQSSGVSAIVAGASEASNQTTPSTTTAPQQQPGVTPQQQQQPQQQTGATVPVQPQTQPQQQQTQQPQQQPLPPAFERIAQSRGVETARTIQGVANYITATRDAGSLFDALLEVDKGLGTQAVMAVIAKYGKDEVFVKTYQKLYPDLFQQPGARPATQPAPGTQPATQPAQQQQQQPQRAFNEAELSPDPEIAALQKIVLDRDKTIEELKQFMLNSTQTTKEAKEAEATAFYDRNYDNELYSIGKFIGDSIKEVYPQIPKADLDFVLEYVARTIETEPHYEKQVRTVTDHKVVNNTYQADTLRQTFQNDVKELTNKILKQHMNGRVTTANTQNAAMQNLHTRTTPVNPGTQGQQGQPTQPTEKKQSYMDMVRANYRARNGTQGNT